jgi:hypothetical protein
VAWHGLTFLVDDIVEAATTPDPSTTADPAAGVTP